MGFGFCSGIWLFLNLLQKLRRVQLSLQKIGQVVVHQPLHLGADLLRRVGFERALAITAYSLKNSGEREISPN
jgi:hypothetical protein